MGCSVCRGHAHQVCSAPGCHDENEDLKREAAEQNTGWQKIIRNPIRCDLCNKVATYGHPSGGFRCDTCPRPAK